jgi:hypothetical protein
MQVAWQGLRDGMLCLQGELAARAQVAWQGLLDDSGDGSVLDDAGAKGKASVAAAALTTQRVLLLSATLRVLAAAAAAAVAALGRPRAALLHLCPQGARPRRMHLMHSVVTCAPHGPALAPCLLHAQLPQ